MRVLLLALLIGCAPFYTCQAPCQGQSAQVEREAGVVCYCFGNPASSSSMVDPPDGASVLIEQQGILAAKFAWTDSVDVCAGYRQWWAARAPLPCAQPGGGKKEQNR
jgi:hypothetical protein